MRCRLFRRAFTPFHTAAIKDDARVVDSVRIGDRDAWEVATPNASYWFDATSGLLLRRVIYYESPIGRMPEQADFAVYRDAGGGKLPFSIRASLIDPWSGGILQGTTVRFGTPLPPRYFEKP